MIEITDTDRVRTIQLQRPEAKNAMNEALWDATTEALKAAAIDPSVAVVVFTGSGDSFSAGQDVLEMAQRDKDTFIQGTHGFQGFTNELVDFPKPFICAVNGLAVGFGVTILGLADLVFMSSAARLKCPFTALGVAPELGSSFTFPRLIGRQNSTWMLMSSEWVSAEDAHEMGIAWKTCEPGALMDVTMNHARTLAANPISSLVESKRVIMEAIRPQIAAARAQEDAAFALLMGGPANVEAMQAFAEKRAPDFTNLVS